MHCGAADTLIGNLTVFEMLLYTADLKLPRRMPYKDKVRKVSHIITQLALNTCQHVRIGSPVQRGISGERSEVQHWPGGLACIFLVQTVQSPARIGVTWLCQSVAAEHL